MLQCVQLAPTPGLNLGIALRLFLSALIDNGRVVVDEPAAGLPPAENADMADDLLAECDRLARQHLAFTPPDYLPDVARWAAHCLQAACQCLVYRQIDEAAVRRLLGVACPRPPSAGVIYSADLLLQYLADLAPLARAAAEQDVLVNELMRLGAAWPLSSIGMAGLAPRLDNQAIDLILDNRCLRQLYVDRTIAHRDRARLEHAQVREAVCEALGFYDEIWPEAAPGPQHLESKT